MVSLQLYQNSGQGPGEPQLVVGNLQRRRGHLRNGSEKRRQSTRRCGQPKERQ
jgi:hypothetical protein